MATKEQLDRIDAMLTGAERTIRSAFRQFLRAVQSDEVIAEIEARIRANDIAGALDIVNKHAAQMGASFWQAVTGVGTETAKELAALFPATAAAIYFDPSHPRAAEAIRQNRLEWINEFTESQRQATQQALARGFEQGWGTQRMVREFRESIGLTLHQDRAINNYRDLLEKGSAEALQRELRDRRFDTTVRTAVRTREPLSAAQIDRMVERYRARYLAYRGETIARTEALRATSIAREEATRQMIEQADIAPDEVKRTWHATHDRRVRHWHASMDGQKRGLEELFTDGLGNRLRYPGDARAPASTTLNCFPANTIVDARNIRVGYRRFYEGRLIVIKTAGGRNLAGTPNHPILTARGWVPLNMLNESDYAVCGAFSKRGSSCDPYINHMPSCIAEKFNTISDAGHSVRSPTIGVDFHGDGMDGNVDIVFADRELMDGAKSSPIEPFNHIQFSNTDGDSFSSLPSSRAGREMVMGHLLPSNAVMSGFDLNGPLDTVHISPFESFGLGSSANVAATDFKKAADSISGNTEFIRHHFFRHPAVIEENNVAQNIHVTASPMRGDAFRMVSEFKAGLNECFLEGLRTDTFVSCDLSDGMPIIISLDKIIDIRELAFSDHVYNLETESGAYIANGLVVHNCRCAVTVSIDEKL